MKTPTVVDSSPFQLDATNERLLCRTAKGTQSLRLRPKTFAVLSYLLERNQKLVTKEQFLDALWPGTWVTDSALKSCIRELRSVLGDDPRAPRFIETVHRRGYRFIGQVGGREAATNDPRPTTENWHSTTPLVGRDSELARLRSLFGEALSGERRMVFVTGEAGIGKTTLADTFLLQIRAHVILRLGQGQCVEHYGPGEPYMPIFEALGRLCREPEGRPLAEVLHHYAPSWLGQMAPLLKATKLAGSLHQLRGSSRERMLREMAAALEVIAQERPLILVLEDLHWSDYSTLELLAVLARRQEPARLMVIATYRPTEMASNSHPLRRVLDELQLHGHSHTIPLGFLTQPDVAAYLLRRFPDHRSLHTLAVWIHQRTEGNPLFMMSVIDELVRQGRVTAVNGQWLSSGPLIEESIGVPDSLTSFITRQIEDLSNDEQRILETASVVGVEFPSALVAAVLAEDTETIETHCDTLTRQGRFLQSAGPSEQPDGTIAARYRFVHAFYRDVLYNRLGVNQRVRLHEHIGRQQEAAYGRQANEIASQIALHFERGRNYPRAVHHHQQAGENALQRSAHQEALIHFDAALRLLKKLLTDGKKVERELTLHIARTAPLGMTYGYGSPIVAAAYKRAHLLSQHARKTPRLFSILAGLTSVCHMHGELRRANELEGQLLRIARRAGNRTLLLWAYLFQGVTADNRDQLAFAQARLEAGLTLYDPQRHNPRASSGREDPGILCLTTLVSILWLRGYPDQALQKLHKALSLAEHSADPLSRAMVLGQAAVLYQRRREGRAALASADAFLALTQEQGFSFRAATGMIYRGWALADCGDVKAGIAQMRTGLEVIETSGSSLALPYYLALVGETYGKAGHTEEAIQVLKKALAIAHSTGDRVYEAELWRLRGILMRGKTVQERYRRKDEEAERCFQRARRVARQQKAKSLELRAAVSLGQAWAAQGKEKEAYLLLNKGYRWFTEGFDTKDLQEAKTMLEELT